MALDAPSFWPGFVPPRPPDDATWLALTLVMEAGREPWAGQVAVAYVITGRARRAQASVVDTVLKPWQFSAWNTAEPTRAMLDTIPLEVWTPCYFAALGALGGFVPDPSHGASHYLNPDVTRALRTKKGLSPYPRWAADPGDPERLDPAKVTAVIAHHAFLKVD